MASFFRGEVDKQSTRAVLIGADSPSLPADFIQSAFRSLGKADVVLGPATDGGIYLVGCRCWIPALFEEMEWSQPQVLAHMIARIARLKLRLAVLPPWYDVDTIEGWQVLVGHVRALRQAGMEPELPRLEALIRRDGESWGQEALS
jgi:glycosyltransferase A (GT-A) superfamily protein (DUF2064 family)